MGHDQVGDAALLVLEMVTTGWPRLVTDGHVSVRVVHRVVSPKIRRLSIISPVNDKILISRCGPVFSVIVGD